MVNIPYIHPMGMTVDVILVDEGDRMQYFVFGTHPELSSKTLQAFDHCSFERVWDCVMDQLVNHVKWYYHRQDLFAKQTRFHEFQP